MDWTKNVRFSPPSSHADNKDKEQELRLSPSLQHNTIVSLHIFSFITSFQLSSLHCSDAMEKKKKKTETHLEPSNFPYVEMEHHIIW